MDVFTAIVLGGLAVAVIAFVVIGLWHPRSAMSVVDKDREVGWADQAMIEEREVPEMIEGQNEYRRARGERELTEEEVRRGVAGDQRASIERADRAARSGPA